MTLKILKLIDGVLLRFVRTLQPIDGWPTYFFDQAKPVINDVTRLVVVARRALLVHVLWLEPQFGIATHRAVMPGMPLALMESTAADARVVEIALTDVSVECLLGFSHVVGPGL